MVLFRKKAGIGEKTVDATVIIEAGTGEANAALEELDKNIEHETLTVGIREWS